MPKTIASLFSGCGGLDLGFTGGFDFLGRHYERLNTEIVFANDFDADAQVCYNSNPLLTNDGANCLLADIRNVMANLEIRPIMITISLAISMAFPILSSIPRNMTQRNPPGAFRILKGSGPLR